MEDALEAGAADFASEDGMFEITTEPDDVYAISEALEQKGYNVQSAEKDKIPQSYVTLSDENDINLCVCFWKTWMKTTMYKTSITTGISPTKNKHQITGPAWNGTEARLKRGTNRHGTGIK